jgi:hypothetical protein
MRLDTFIKWYKPIRVNTYPTEYDSWWNYVVDNYHLKEGKKLINKYYGKYFVATLVECESSFYVIQGYHYVNRMGYIFTEKITRPNIKVS